MTLSHNAPGVLTIHDDIFIYGKDDKDHDVNLVNFFNVAQKEGLVFIRTKCAIKQDSDNLFWRHFLSQRLLARSR